jgi:hypothetical protein
MLRKIGMIQSQRKAEMASLNPRPATRGINGAATNMQSAEAADVSNVLFRRRSPNEIAPSVPDAAI